MYAKFEVTGLKGAKGREEDNFNPGLQSSRGETINEFIANGVAGKVNLHLHYKKEIFDCLFIPSNL